MKDRHLSCLVKLILRESRFEAPDDVSLEVAECDDAWVSFEVRLER